MTKVNEQDYRFRDPDAFIWAWNKVLSKYGDVTVANFKELLIGSEDKVTFTDHKIGWTEKLTPDDFRRRRLMGGGFTYQLILPEPRELA